MSELWHRIRVDEVMRGRERTIHFRPVDERGRVVDLLPVSLCFLGNNAILYEQGVPLRGSSSNYSENDVFEVPPELQAAFNAGDDWRPILDWLVENYAQRERWLAPLVTRIVQGVANAEKVRNSRHTDSIRGLFSSAGDDRTERLLRQGSPAHVPCPSPLAQPEWAAPV